MKSIFGHTQAHYKYFLIVFLFVLLLTFSSGCSAIKKITGYKTTPTNAEEMVQPSTVLSLPESTYKKDSLELSMSNPKTLNPLDASDYSIDQVLKLIYDPLLSVSPNNELTPNLVDSIDEISPTSLRITLKSNLFFHSGSPLESKDVRYSFEYIKTHPLSTYYFTTTYISSITEIDPLTFDIVFFKADQYNRFSLTFPIISKDYVSSKEYAPLQPVGSGPYQVTRFQSMINMELSSYATYHGVKPSIKRVSVSIMRKFEDGYNMFVSKRVDVFSTQQTNWHEYSNDKNLKINTYDSPFFYYIGVNLSDTLLKEIDGRKLLASNLPYTKIKKEAFLGHINFTTLPILPQLQASQKLDVYYSKNDVDSYYMREYAPEKMYTYLKNLRSKGYPIIDQVPWTYKLIYNLDEVYQTFIAKEIALANNRYPLIIQCVGLDTQNYYEALKQNQYDLFIGTLKVSFIPTLDTFYGTNGVDNINGYSDINLDGLLTSFRMVQTETSLIKQVENLSKILSDELPVIPLGFLENGFFSHEQIINTSNTHYYNLYQNVISMKITTTK